MNISGFGLTLELAKNCSFYENKESILLGKALYETSPQYVYQIGTNVSNSLLCHVPFYLTQNRTSLYLTLKNAQHETNPNGYTIEFYEPPILKRNIPTSGPSYGGTNIQIIGTGILPTSKVAPFIYCKFGNILCEKPCERIDSENLLCEVQAHPPSEVVFSMSYNKLDWHPVNSTTFTYTTCDAGYTAANYKEVCKLCSPGSYKPTSGLYECLKCSNGTFSSFAGALTCEKCSDNTIGFETGSTSHEGCLCKSGTYYNHEIYQQAGANKKCIDCPPGAFCPFNSTIPLSLPGFWRSQDNFQNFYSCFPKESCGGFAPENCTAGYEGIRCGKCQTKYYKFRGKCAACGESWLVWIRLLGIVSLMALITGVFFALSSAKVHHLASIAIAFSFWQVLSMFAKFDIQWPSLIGGTLTASSVSNFNTDFLSPNCIFQNMSYVSLWVLQMLLPIYFLASFGTLYVILIVRSMFATVVSKLLSLINVQIKYITPISLKKKDELGIDEEQIEKIPFIKKVLVVLANILGKVANFSIWFVSQKSTGRDLVKILNRIINGYFAFLSFSFIFIMTTASEVFVCTKQTDGLYTLNGSPDIRCYQDATWLTMMPMTIVWYLIFGVGSAIYFILIFFNYTKWSKNLNFRERNKFMLSRFRNKLFFWEAVITLRKTILSVLYIFLDEMLVIVAGIFLLFIGFLLHTNFVPFKRKFHNVMDYFVIIVTMSTLFFGFLFFVDRFPEGTKGLAEWLAFIVIIGSTVIVVSMILWDANTRRKNDKKKLRNRLLKLIKDQEQVEETRVLLVALHQKEENDDMFQVKALPWDVDYEYKPMDFQTDSETPEESFSNMNDIFGDLLSWKRISRKLFLIQRKGQKTTTKIVKKFKKKT
jgi:hypothetical protein